MVARNNTVIYQHLQRSVGREPGVEIIYDRRPTPVPPGTLTRLATHVKRVLRPTPAEDALAALGRRKRARIDEEVRMKGWAVVRLDDVPRA